MSRAICSDAILGAREVVQRARATVTRTIAEHGADHPVAFPGTAYHLPVIYSFTGVPVAKLSDMEPVLQRCERLLPDAPSDALWLPYLGDALDAGAATLFAFEMIEACRTLSETENPVRGIWLGAANDVIMRERGVEFVDGTAPGFAAVIGAAPDAATAVRIARELQEKNLYVFMAGAVDGVTFAEQLDSEGVQLGWETRLVPFGRDVSACIYALGFASRTALSFGGVAPGDHVRNLRYNKNRIFAFVLALGTVDQEKYAAAAGAINYGFPTIADTDIPEILPTGVCTYEHVVSRVPHDRIVERALEVRGCKVRITKVPVPVAYGPAFEGERIRKRDARVEFGGNVTPAFEFVTSAEIDDIVDGEITIVGPEVDEVEEGAALPLGIWVEAAGRKMQPDFEPILERQIHHLVNGAEGVWHMGQRDIVWTRISKGAFARGFRLRHYGEILHAKLLGDYPAIVDKVRVTLITEREEVERRQEVARRVYLERNERLSSMTDESVDTFYSCLLCQSFAPDHVCIITPERLGLCGAYNWLDGKAAHEIDETGPNQPVKKGACIDPVRGIWEGVNEYVYANSHRTIECFTAYSLMDRPMTSCGCFEAIMAFVPECNGVMIVNREFPGDTPVGMSFSTLAGMVGGGAQTPGFMGIGKAFISSRKFLSADGGIGRIVWMPAELKGMIRRAFEPRCEEEGLAGLLDRIVDEARGVAPSDVRRVLEQEGHPALSMPDMATLWVDADPATLASAATAVRGSPATTPSPSPPLATTACADATAPAPAAAPKTPEPGLDRAALVAEIKSELKAQIEDELRNQLTREIVGDIIGALRERLLGERPAAPPEPAPASRPLPAAPVLPPSDDAGTRAEGRGEAPPRAGAERPVSLYAREKLEAVARFQIPRDPPGRAIETVTLGATISDGGTRRRTLTLGGQDCLPFHFYEGSMPHRPVYALEVFDSVSDKTSPVLRRVWGELLGRPVEMAVRCVEEHGADAISVRLAATHPERGGRSPDDALALVRDVLAAVDVPVIVTAHNHFESANEVFKKVGAGCQGERLLLNWVEGDNYRTIAGVALAYGHCVVAQSPIDVNLAKQLNILLTNMDLPRDQIVMDPMTGALGYGLEYTYSVMERIRSTALGGDEALAFPMIVTAGQESWKVKEAHAEERDFPAWGERSRRALMWEVQTAMPLILAGADLLVLYHPGSVAALRRNVERLCRVEVPPDGAGGQR